MRTALLLIACWTAACTSTPVTPDGTNGRAAVPTVAALEPSEGPVGTTVTIVGSGFTASGNYATFGAGFIRNLTSAGGDRLQFIIPDGLDVCSPGAQGPCPGAFPPVTPGDYAIAVTAAGQTSNTVTFKVTAR